MSGVETGTDGDYEPWEEACRREEAIRDLISRCPEGLTRSDVDHLAWELELSRATVYRLIKRYRDGGTVTALMPAPPGRPKGYRTLDAAREALIRRTIDAFFLRPTRPSFARLVHEIRSRCLEAGLPPPNWRTIKQRLAELDFRVRARRRGEEEAMEGNARGAGEHEDPGGARDGAG